MPSIKDLKKRITTVKNTQQTTRAMKMVSAAKLRRSQEAIVNHRPYARKIQSLIHSLTPLISAESFPKLAVFQGSKSSQPTGEQVGLGGVQKQLLVVVTSERGLCGSFNGNVLKLTQRVMGELSQQHQEFELSFIGKKGYDFFKTKSVKIASHFPDLTGKVTAGKAKKLAQTLLAQFLAGHFSQIRIIYNEFASAGAQITRIETFLPLVTELAASPPLDYIERDQLPEVYEQLLEKSFSNQILRIFLESQASEHAARMAAMENATKNAGEMIRKLTLLYNKTRQAGITKELLEIIAGSESQKNA